MYDCIFCRSPANVMSVRTPAYAVCSGRTSNKDVVITATNGNNSTLYVSCSVSAFIKYFGCLSIIYLAQYFDWGTSCVKGTSLDIWHFFSS